MVEGTAPPIVLVAAIVTVRARQGRLRRPSRFPIVNSVCMALLYGRGGRVTALLGGDRSGQTGKEASELKTD